MVPITVKNIQQTLQELSNQYQIVSIIDLDYWGDGDYESNKEKLLCSLQAVHQTTYDDNQRIVFTQSHEVTVNNQSIVLSNLLLSLNEIDISAFFVIIVSTNPDIKTQVAELHRLSIDPVSTTAIVAQGDYFVKTLEKLPYSKKEMYQYGSLNPLKVNLNELSSREQFLLTESKTFCMYPWIHLHAWPTGQAFPCCMSEPSGQIGNCRTQTLSEIWNSNAQRQLRVNMLNETPSSACTRCYEQEGSGFFSGRLSANKHHGHYVSRAIDTHADGTVDRFEMTYWDIRFSNLCNLKCRSCGHIFSSQWYQDQAQLAGPEWKSQNKVLNYAGRTEIDMWEQLEPHLDYVEQIYFAGGEPLLMEEHYRILDELVRRERFDVRLIYNTNFTHTDLKGKSVFEYWKKFKSVAVGASLDDMDSRAEYIRKGTDWQQIEKNRQRMLEICPDVDFYISPTLSILNALHLPKFHRTWVEKNFIRAQDLNVNILQDPAHYRIDIATPEYKQQLTKIYQDHIMWLKAQGDELGRATQGFESAIAFMNTTDNTHLIDTFWRKTHELDAIRRESCLSIVPELKALQ
jgi:sulfatase maturation enzyme AslB (radical SAM superfamily)